MRKNIFVSFRIKPIFVVGMILLLSFVLSYSIVKVSALAQPKSQYTIVLDAGHGGEDGGCVGSIGIKESDLNLNVVKKLQPYLVGYGFDVVLTRKDNGSLDPDKQKDMAEREEIIRKAQANLVLSIHMNSYPTSDQYGAQVYYQEGTEESKKFAETMQAQFKNNLHTKREANHGDYYILKCSNTPTVLVECGYLSNPEEEQLLVSGEYQEKLAYQIFCGIVKYLNIRKN